MSITIGFWIFPLLFTIVSVGGVVFWDFFMRPPGGRYDFRIDSAICFLVAVTLSLAFWLAWALFWK